MSRVYQVFEVVSKDQISLNPLNSFNHSKLPIPKIRLQKDFIPNMSCMNMLLPECPCLTALARTSLITEFCLLRQNGVSRGEALTKIGIKSACCRSHFKCSLLKHHPIYDED